MNTTVFEAINITKKYRNTLALNQVSMSVMQGDISVRVIRNSLNSVRALVVLLRVLLFILI